MKKSRYYRVDFAFGELTSYQRVAVSNLIPESCGVAFGQLSLCVSSIRGKKMANELKIKIGDYLDFCHVMHFSDLSSEV